MQLRHCERSEAIHLTAQRTLDCFVASLLAMTPGYSFAFSLRDAPEVCARQETFVTKVETRAV
jgi:hypothetical protein